MTAQTNKKNTSIKRKLVPATAMLLASAMALASSTYAWFTMSREVEVQNIQMVATTPEDIQISLGQIAGSGGTAATTDEAYSLAKGTGWLMSGSSSGVIAPREGTNESGAVVEKNELDWSNIADVSKYYEFGKLIPASSTDGANIFFTPDAAGVGRTMKSGAKFYQAATGSVATVGNTVGEGGSSDALNATAHILNTTEKTGVSEAGAVTGTGWVNFKENTANDKYTKSTSWNVTNSDGYYIDIPVWLRTSSTEAPNIYVSGYVTSQKTGDTADTTDTDDLYKAVRIAVLSTSGDNGMTYGGNQGPLTLKDGTDIYTNPTSNPTGHGNLFPTTQKDANILDSDNYSGDGTNAGRSGTAANGTGRGGTDGKLYGVSGTGTDNAGAWTEITTVNNASTKIATLAAGAGTTYGASTKIVLRVWLEGEDGNCWNENAGQDWNIALKFSKDPLPAGT